MKKVADEIARPVEPVALPEVGPRQWVPKAEYMKLFELGPDPAFFEDTRELGGFVGCPVGRWGLWDDSRKRPHPED